MAGKKRRNKKKKQAQAKSQNEAAGNNITETDVNRVGWRDYIDHYLPLSQEWPAQYLSNATWFFRTELQHYFDTYMAKLDDFSREVLVQIGYGYMIGPYMQKKKAGEDRIRKDPCTAPVPAMWSLPAPLPSGISEKCGPVISEFMSTYSTETLPAEKTPMAHGYARVVMMAYYDCYSEAISELNKELCSLVCGNDESMSEIWRKIIKRKMEPTFVEAMKECVQKFKESQEHWQESSLLQAGTPTGVNFEDHHLAGTFTVFDEANGSKTGIEVSNDDTQEANKKEEETEEKYKEEQGEADGKECQNTDPQIPKKGWISAIQTTISLMNTMPFSSPLSPAELVWKR